MLNKGLKTQFAIICRLTAHLMGWRAHLSWWGKGNTSTRYSDGNAGSETLPKEHLFGEVRDLADGR